MSAKVIIPGDVVRLRPGLRPYHHQANSVTTLGTAILVRIEAIRKVECCILIRARALSREGDPYLEGAVLTFARTGKFRPEFIQSELIALRHIK